MRLKTRMIFGAGYLLGTRSKTDHFHEIVEGLRGFLASDRVRGYVDKVQAWAEAEPEPAGPRPRRRR